MNRVRTKATVAVVALLALAAAAFWWWSRSPSASGTAAPQAPPAAVSVVDGVTVVTLPPAVQRASGVLTTPASAAQAAAESTAYGVVLDLQPLVDWRARYLAAAAQARTARARLSAATAELQRTRALYQDDRNASLQALQAAQAQESSQRTLVESGAASLDAVRQQALQQFGPVLARWAAAPSGAIERLLDHRDSIVAISPFGNEAAPPPQVSVSLGDGPRRPATWISAAATADPRLGTGLQLYRVAAAWPAHAGVVASLAARSAAQGTFVPLPAVVWFADQPWAYVRRGAAQFARVSLLGATETGSGFIVPGRIKPGEPVVTQGAGLLLSQEQLPPPGAPACKDPECDD